MGKPEDWEITPEEIGELGEPEAPGPPSSGSLAEQEQKRLFSRVEQRIQFANLRHWTAMAVFVLFVFIAVALVGVWTWHIVMPPERLWMSAESFAKMESRGVSGIIGAVTAIGVKNFLSDQRDD